MLESSFLFADKMGAPQPKGAGSLSDSRLLASLPTAVWTHGPIQINPLLLALQDMRRDSWLVKRIQ